MLLIDFKPKNKSNTSNSQNWIEVKNLETYFTNWIIILEKYESISSFYDDPILKSFTEEYYAEFEIIDDDKEQPLKTKQILLLDEYLEFVENTITNFQNTDNESQIEEIRNDVINLRENLSSKSKAWVVKNLSKIWGKLTKQGVKFMKEFLSEGRKKLIQEGIKYVVENGSDFINLQ
jgi:hypothetical protein